MPVSNVQCDVPRCGAFIQLDGTVCWRVWAASAPSVDLVLIGSGSERHFRTMRNEAAGYFTWVEHAPPEGQQYAFRLSAGPERPDPASRWQFDGLHHPSALVFPERFVWSEGDWAGIPRDRLVIYELHVGTFTPAGTFDAIIPRLDSLRELGVTALELMPICQFPGDRNWGYDGVYPYAVQNSYGGPHGLQRLINACHRVGLAVILDVVYNHLGPEGNYLSEFGPYFTDRYRTPWGPALNFDDRGCDAVRGFILHNVRQWIRDFRVDGLRLDAVHAIFDSSPRHILRDIKEVADEEARALGRPVHVIAESNLNDVRLLDAPDRRGYGLDAQWSDDFHHCVHTILTGERTGYYVDFGDPDQLAKAINETFVYDGCISSYRGRRHGAPAGGHAGDRFVVSIQTHDQVGNRACGDRFGTLLTPAQQRLAAGLLLLAPHLPLLFMGEEYGEQQPFPFFCSFGDEALIESVRQGRMDEFAAFHWQGEIPDPQSVSTFESAKLTWSWPEGSWQNGLRRLYRDLLSARNVWPALQDYRNRLACLTGVPGDPRQILRLTRGGSAIPHEDQLIVYFNLSRERVPMPDEERGDAAILLSSEAPRYSGQALARDGSTAHRVQPDAHSPDGQTQSGSLQPFEFCIFGPKSWRLP